MLKNQLLRTGNGKHCRVEKTRQINSLRLPRREKEFQLNLRELLGGEKCCYPTIQNVSISASDQPAMGCLSQFKTLHNIQSTTTERSNRENTMETRDTEDIPQHNKGDLQKAQTTSTQTERNSKHFH